MKNELSKKHESSGAVFLTRKQVAEQVLNCSERTVHNLTLEGVLKKYKIGGMARYLKSEVEDAILNYRKDQ